jgi:hypothetical protein
MGFRRVGDSLYRGTISWKTAEGTESTTDATILILEAFPFVCPRVIPDHIPGTSWHQDRDNAMCLWTRGDESASLPWQDAATLVGRAAQWLANCSNDWADQEPDLDVERYLPAIQGLFVYRAQNIDDAIGSALRLRHRKV